MLIVAQATKTSVTATNHVGTAALGCPAEQRSAGLREQDVVGASLDWTAEGGCPHVVRG